MRDPCKSIKVLLTQAGHISNYYLSEIIQDEDVAAVQAAAEKLGVAVENTR
jgi:dipeptidyl-peptidase-3